MVSKTTKIGEIACTKFDLRAYEKAAIVSKPTMEVSYDRIVDLDGKLFKVQIRHTGYVAPNSSGSVVCKFQKSGNGKIKYFEEGEVDAFVAYIPAIDKFCWFDYEMIKHKTRISIRFEKSKNNQQKGCFWAEDYFW